MFVPTGRLTITVRPLLPVVIRRKTLDVDVGRSANKPPIRSCPPPALRPLTPYDHSWELGKVWLKSAQWALVLQHYYNSSTYEPNQTKPEPTQRPLPTVHSNRGRPSHLQTKPATADYIRAAFTDKEQKHPHSSNVTHCVKKRTPTSTSRRKFHPDLAVE